ncbi:MAG: Big 5 protein, partial [Thermodesulfobacteriota bacterium]|nr:Big 5 protein [Thermodesulfobacteriota bacterium]
MKKLCLLKSLACLAALFIIVGMAVAEECSTGWQCPAGSCDRNASTSEGNYVTDGGYPGHVGIDYMRPVGYSVQAVAHGLIVDYKPDRNYYGSACGSTGGAMLVHHVAKGHDGYFRSFYAVYGHMYKKSGLEIGDIVEQGEVIGNVHQYYGDGNGDGVCTDAWPHLHFGMKPDVEPAANTDDRFRGVCGSGGECGWTHPMNFLDDNFPANSDVSCEKLRNKYPDVFRQMEIFSCQDAVYIYPDQYVVSHYVTEGFMDYWGMKDIWFRVNSKAEIVEIAGEAPAGIGYGGGSNDGVGNVTSPDQPFTYKPDLFVKSLEFENDKVHYYHDEDFHIIAKTKNAGEDVDSSLDRIRVKLYRFEGDHVNDDLKDWSEYMRGEELERGESATEHFIIGAPDPDPSESKKYQFYACTDKNGDVSESNENNNCLGNIICRVRKRPNLNMINLTLDGGRTQFTRGENPYAEGTATNSGGEPYEDVKMKFYLNGSFIGEGNMRAYNLE